MKQLIIASVFLFSTIVYAGAAPTSLREVMAVSAQHFSAIARSINAPEQNAESAMNASGIRIAFVTAFQFEPDILRNAPESERPALLRLYQKLVAKTVALSAELEDAFIANDNTKAKTLLADLARVRQEGHTVFDTAE
ncbi:MAG: hypothetical protein AB7F59_07680 [Bdellovibrionales bacterium]